MNVVENKSTRILRCLMLLAALVSSCSDKNQTSNQVSQKVALQATVSSNDARADTTLRLNFETGIRSILEDQNGNIWFGSHQEGLCRFDGKQFTYFTTDDGLSSNQIRSIYEDSNGRVWFEGGTGISSFDGQKIVTHTYKNYHFMEHWQMGENDLWFKEDPPTGYSAEEGNFGVYRYDGQSLNFHAFPLPKTDDKWSYSVSTPFSKGKGRVWFGTYVAVFGYNGESFTIIDNQSLGLNETTGYLHIRSIFEDSKERLWMGNNGIGVLLYDGIKTINFSEMQGLISKNSLRSGGFRSPAKSLEHVFAIGEDRNGNIWFGDRDTGAWKYDGQSMKNYTSADGLTTSHIWQIYNTPKDELWFAMDDGNVLKFNGTSFEVVF